MQTELAPETAQSKPRPYVPDHRAGKYLIVGLGQEKFGIPVLHAREILGVKHVVAVPNSSGTLMGFINLRGKIIPVVNLLSHFHLPAAPSSDTASIVVVQTTRGTDTVYIGIAIDRVIAVANRDGLDDPRTSTNDVRLLVDIDRMLTAAEYECLDSMPTSTN